jgi:hypothetical protein
MKLRDWIPFKKLDKENLLQNPSAIHLINNIEYSYFSRNYYLSSNILELIYRDKYWIKDENNKWQNNFNIINCFKEVFNTELKPIDLHSLSENPNIFNILKENPYLDVNIIKYSLSSNPAAIDFLESNPNKINWVDICKNSKAIHLIKQNINKINDAQSWWILCYNPKAIKIIKENLDKIGELGWRYLSGIPDAIEILEQNQDKIDWQIILKNPAAMDLIMDNLDKVDIYHWYMVCRNPAAMDLIKKNINNTKKEDWSFLGLNRGNYDQINKDMWKYLSRNPAIFTYDYDKIKETFRQLNKEIIELYWHPKRIDLWIWQNDLY